MSDLRAVLDLGSNSFHLLLVRPERSGFVVVERLKEKVQLLAGFKDGEIQEAAIGRGVACIARFSQRLSEVEPAKIKAVGTCALRQARNRQVFIDRVTQILGVPVEVVAGEEEARLVYLGVAHHVPKANVPRLVVDIGGGSTEVALGHGKVATARISTDVGCVALNDRHFDPRCPQSNAYRSARAEARELIRASLEADPEFTTANGENREVFGTSGTIESIAMVLAANGWATEGITHDGLAALEEAIVTERWLVDAGMPGLAPDRVDIFPAGVAVLAACFELLGLTEMKFVDVSLMQGVVCDVLATDVETDRREESVALLAERFRTDRNQSRRVADCALRLYSQTQAWWDGDEECARLLRWAAELHEIGTLIDARHYHRHGGYIVKHTSLLGFSSLQQRALALLVRGHRRSFPVLAFRAFDAEIGDKLKRLVALLRLAVILERSHSDLDSPAVSMHVEGNVLDLVCPQGWLETHTLSRRELEVEIDQLGAAGLRLTVAAE